MSLCLDDLRIRQKFIKTQKCQGTCLLFLVPVNRKVFTEVIHFLAIRPTLIKTCTVLAICLPRSIKCPPAIKWECPLEPNNGTVVFLKAINEKLVGSAGIIARCG